MKKILKILVIVIFVTSLLECQDKYHETYTLRYYYIEGCANCEFFTKKGIPLIEKEFGKHMKIVKYNMDDATSFDKVKKAYDHDLEQPHDFDYDQYGVGPFLVLENHYAQLGVYDIEKFLNNLIRAVSGEKLMAPEKIEKYYYFKDN